ncbi:hypothetical protein SHI21_04670 [Bacteriovorax sp. PP10]|uniref:Uncharacterized protein n=1 Tax=Bacteriovorax antarcticus TaxID=3088717 RepID=A0ABU5VR04_9BACT|nr:hypothetical protein [Bacteriovorax sp. PP10]MEA9355477.1 hypothetical protein [Bacteriovorax sp. PP10]
MKKIFVLFFFLMLSTSSYAACNKKITSKDVIFFVDLNGGNKEIEEAQKAACDKGQKLVIYPEQTAAIYKLTNDKSFYENRYKALTCDKTPTKKGCAEVRKKKDEVMSELEEKAVKFSIPVMKETLKKLNSEEGRNVESLVISGHSNGKTIFGVYGTTQRDAIQTTFKDLPDEGKSVSSLVMLACYSANPSTILSWKKNLPGLKMIAGSDASASASDRPAGLKYLKDLLMKVKDLTADADQKMLEKRLKVLIPTLKEVNSAIYIDSNKCGESVGDKRFFYSKSSGGLNVFNPEACEKSIAQYKEKEEDIAGYMEGITPIPVETHGTPLRELYSFLRQNAHCLEAGQAQYTADMLYGLLFYHQVKINAIRALKKEADEINAVLVDFGVGRIWPLTEENIKNKSRKEIIDNLDAIFDVLPKISGNSELLEDIKKLEGSLKTMACVSPEWHDIQTNPRAPMCSTTNWDNVMTINPQALGVGMPGSSGTGLGAGLGGYNGGGSFSGVEQSEEEQ